MGFRSFNTSCGRTFTSAQEKYMEAISSARASDTPKTALISFSGRCPPWALSTMQPKAAPSDFSAMRKLGSFRQNGHLISRDHFLVAVRCGMLWSNTNLDHPSLIFVNPDELLVVLV